jgi:peptidoglycan/xylan/chitin deacetylase (PgdA/CDA1 family)
MPDILALCYHSVSESWGAHFSVTPQSLTKQLELVLARGYEGTTFTRAIVDPPAARTLAVTFDDAFGSVFDVARPIMDDLGLVGTVYVPTNFPDGPDSRLRWPGVEHYMAGSDEPELRPMSWDELNSLQAAGWEIGSHTKSHPFLTSIGDDELDEELSMSRRIVEERMGRPCRSLAYPYGDHDDRVVEAARRAGYTTAGTLPGRLRTAGPLRWPRVGVYGIDNMRRFRLKVSRGMRLVRASPVWPEKSLTRFAGA